MPKRLKYPDAGEVPPEVAEYLAGKKARPSWSYRDVWQDEHSAAFAVAKLMEQSLVETMQEHVTSAIHEGKSYDDFKKGITPILQKAGWWGRDAETGAQLGSPSRLDLIIKTNVRQARAAGAWKRIEQSKRALPYLYYRLGASLNHRPDHVAIAEKPTVLPVDHPYWTYGYPPNGWHCMCWVQQVTRAAFKAMGSPEPEGVDPIEVKDPDNGRTYTTVPGVAGEFAYNPGKNRWGGLERQGIVKPKPRPRPKPKPEPVDPEAAARAARVAERARILAERQAAEQARAERHQIMKPLAAAVTEQFKRGAMSQVRTTLRKMLAVHKLELRPRGVSDVGNITEHTMSAYARLTWQGEIQVSPAARFAIATKNPAGLSALVHEEVHAHGSLSSDNYVAHSAIEEVSTEVIARKITREALAAHDFEATAIHPDTIVSSTEIRGAYGQVIRRTVRVVLAVIGGEAPTEADRDAAIKLVEDTSLRFKQTSRVGITDLTEQWVSLTGLTPEQQTVLLSRLRGSQVLHHEEQN